MADSAKQLHNSDIDRKPVVLVVEDEVVIRSLLATFLRDSDFAVVEAANADEAVAVLSSQAPVDIVFTDFNMPGEMNGMALAGWVHQHHTEIPVLVTTGAADMLEILAVNSNKYFVPKPYIFSDIEKRIREFLSDS